MDKNDVKLEQVAAQAENFDIPQPFPVFEIFVAMVALGISMILFMFTDFMETDYALYHLMNTVLPQYGWGISFAVGGIVSGMGLLLHTNWLRIFGLVMLAGVYGVMAVCYIMEFPTIGAVVMTGMTLFSLLSIPIVKFTGLGGSMKKAWERKNKRRFL